MIAVSLSTTSRDNEILKKHDYIFKSENLWLLDWLEYSAKNLSSRHSKTVPDKKPSAVKFQATIQQKLRYDTDDAGIHDIEKQNTIIFITIRKC